MRIQLRPLSVEIRAPTASALREELSRHRIADDRHDLAIGDVALVEEPSAQQRNPDGLEVARRRRLHLRPRQTRGLDLWLTFDAHAGEKPAAVVQRKRPRAPRRPYAGQRLQPIAKLGQELRPLRWRRVLAEVQRDAHAEHAVGPNAGID